MGVFTRFGGLKNLMSKITGSIASNSAWKDAIAKPKHGDIFLQYKEDKFLYTKGIMR
jgi:hypothetical protein